MTLMTPSLTAPVLFGYDAPVCPDTIADWQAQLDREFDRGLRGTKLLIRWEHSEPWQTLDRWVLWIAQDPRYVATEPWIERALNGPSPRSEGHYCAQGYCLCEEDGQHRDRKRWVGGATKFIDTQTWRIYRETGLYAWRWWVIQGKNGGHRYKWEKEELPCLVSQLKGLGDQPPAIGDLPYAPFDQRVLRAVRAEQKAARAARALKDVSLRKNDMALEDRDQAEAVAKALWDWTGKQAEDLWSEGADAIPIALEMEYGRAPIGHTIDFAAQERFEERYLTKPVE